MKAPARPLLLPALLLCFVQAGCMAPRARTFSDVSRRRAEAFARWRDTTGQEALPRLDGELTAADAVNLALRYNPTLQQVVQEKRKAEGRLWEAYAEGLPSVDLSADYARLDEISTINIGTESFAVGAKDNWSYKVEVTQPLFKGGSVPLAIKGAKIYRYLNDEAVRQAVQDSVLAVVRAYDDVLLAGRLYEVQEQSLEFAERNLKDVRARREAGVAIRYDELRAEVEVSNVRADMIRERNALRRAWTVLFRAMGVSQKSEVTLVDRLEYVPLDMSFEDAVEIAFSNRPELYQREFDVQLQDTLLRVLHTRYWPSLEAWGWLQWAKPDPHDSTHIGWDRQWQAGLRLTWALFDGMRREGQIIQQKAVLRQSEIALSDTEQQVLEEVKNAVLSLDDARELVESQRLNLAQAEEALRLVQIGSQQGVNTALEVLDARAALTRTSGLYYEALHAHAVARLAFQRAVGLLGPQPGAADVPKEGPPIGVVEPVSTSDNGSAEGSRLEASH